MIITMFRLITLLFFCICVTAYASPNPRIVGGTVAAEGKYPYQVSMKIAQTGGHYCGGTIINSRYILTAAHCIHNEKESDFHILTGTNYLNRGGDVYKIERFIPHKKYSEETGLYDIGLIRVNKNIRFNNRVKPVKLATSSYVPQNLNVTAIGWGKLSKSGPTPNALQEVKLRTISQRICKRFFSQVRSTNLCTLTVIGEGVCRGDSGGPLMLNDTQIGVVSYGSPCAIGYPDVYTKVYPFKPWIEDRIEA